MATPTAASAQTASPTTLARLVDVARLAPSIHNSQPWDWVVRQGTLDLWHARDRRLPASDPTGRQQVISCGASLHHALVAAGALALDVTVEHLPDPARPELLARMTVSPGVGHREVDLMNAVARRCTDRRRFTSWPLPLSRVGRLATAASRSGACVVPIDDVVARVRVERLVEGARRRQLRDAEVVDETARWIDRDTYDGIPRGAIPTITGAPGEHPHRFGPGPDDVDPQLLCASDGLVVIASEDDDVPSWLTAGRALSELWLRATIEGLSVVPLSQAIEDATARDGLRAGLPASDPEPQVLVRLGWQVISRSTLPRTPRHTLEEVLHVH